MTAAHRCPDCRGADDDRPCNPATTRPSYHRARIERERSNSICLRACQPCAGCGQHIPKERTPPLCSKCAPVGEEVTAHVAEESA